ncbi:P-loop NTPase fold protein [Nocardioides ultimimeridianus]
MQRTARRLAIPAPGSGGRGRVGRHRDCIDYINFSTVADSLVELIEQAQGKPLSIGVSGAWGVGKSLRSRRSAGRRPVNGSPRKT